MFFRFHSPRFQPLWHCKLAETHTPRRSVFGLAASRFSMDDRRLTLATSTRSTSARCTRVIGNAGEAFSTTRHQDLMKQLERGLSDRAVRDKSGDLFTYSQKRALDMVAAHSDEITNGPYEYLDTLPNPKTLVPLVEGLQTWFQLQDAQLAILRNIVHTVDQTTLLIDDVMDNDTERRGSDATHVVFGVGHTISTALVTYARVAELASSLSEASCRSLLDELKILYTGHTHEFFQTYRCAPPTIPVHLKVLEQKTGSLFRMTSRMMQAEATKNQHLDINNFIMVLGRYYQILNDFQDITDTALGKIPLSEKDDLDQGLFTLTLIHALDYQNKNGRNEIIEIMRSRSDTEGLTTENKSRIVEYIKEADSLQYTKSVLDKAHEELMHEVSVIDEAAGTNNADMRHYLEYLKSLTATAMATSPGQ